MRLRLCQSARALTLHTPHRTTKIHALCFAAALSALALALALIIVLVLMPDPLPSHNTIVPVSLY